MVLNNPPVNAIDSTFIEQTIEALDRLEGDEDIQGVIITSVSGITFYSVFLLCNAIRRFLPSVTVVAGASCMVLTCLYI